MHIFNLFFYSYNQSNPIQYTPRIIINQSSNHVGSKDGVAKLDQQKETENSHPETQTATTTTTTTATQTTSTTSNKKPKSDAKDKPKAFTIKYKRPRGSRACTVCRSRKVRCDAEIHIPCTNCITFGCECILPEAKKRGNQSGESKAKRQKVNQSKDKPLSATALKRNPHLILQ